MANEWHIEDGNYVSREKGINDYFLKVSKLHEGVMVELKQNNPCSISFSYKTQFINGKRTDIEKKITLCTSEEEKARAYKIDWSLLLCLYKHLLIKLPKEIKVHIELNGSALDDLI